MHRTNLYLDARQTSALDRLSRAQGISRAELVRRLIDRGMEADPAADLDADLGAIEASSGVLAEADWPERGPDARSAHLDDIRNR